MKSNWPKVPLATVLCHRKEFITIDEVTTYRRPRVRLHAEGIVLRDEVAGSLIKTKQQQVCHAGEFLVAEIDAKVGGFGIVPKTLDGSIVSSHYFLFKIDEAKLDPRFLDYFARTPAFHEQVAAQGSTNYAAIRPADVLDYEIPLPPLAEQRRVAMRIEDLAAQIKEARTLRQEAVAELEAIVASCSRHLLRAASNGAAWETERIADVCEEIIDHRGRTPPLSDAGIPHITSANIRHGQIHWRTKKFVTAETYAAFMTRGVPRPDDVLLTTEAPLGEVAVVPDERRFSLAQRLILLRPRANILSGAFLAKALASPAVREDLFAKATATTVSGIASKRLREVRVPVPPPSQQRRIVAELDAVQTEVDRLKNIQADSAFEMDALLPAVLDRAFRGEL